MPQYFGSFIEGDPFIHYSVSHLIMLLITVLVIILMYAYKRASESFQWGRLVLALLLILSEGSLHYWYFANGIFSPVDTLPLELCSISALLCIIMLLTKSYRIYEIVFFWGLGGATQALLTPVLDFPYPYFRFFQFFITHIAIVLACLYMTWIKGYRPTMRSVWKSFGWLQILALCVFAVNKWVGANYMFLSHKPHYPTLLDLLGPYPGYIIWLELIALGVFFLLYAPFGIQNWLGKKKRITSRLISK
ncbi:YwaF family protein [Brevibacillus daliensis]|uniref:YwaF family protein n=1 Tax=Brevibacillus daliensis TaxID=2892995 RepID=UPI001E48A788|nr:TIGR02206 family membrane protein [Brevibacillus daliensis]